MCLEDSKAGRQDTSRPKRAAWKANATPRCTPKAAAALPGIPRQALMRRRARWPRMAAVAVGAAAAVAAALPVELLRRLSSSNNKKGGR